MYTLISHCEVLLLNHPYQERKAASPSL